MLLMLILTVLSYAPASQDIQHVILGTNEFGGAVWKRTVDAPWFVANANRTEKFTSFNPLATSANNTPCYATSTSQLGFDIKSLNGVVVDLVDRIVSLSVRCIKIVSDTFRETGTDFMVSIANILHSIHNLVSRIKSEMLDLGGKASVLVGKWLDIMCDVVVGLSNRTTSLLAQGLNVVENTTSKFMASFANNLSWTLEIGLGIKDRICHFVSSLSIKDQLRLAFILCLSVLLLLALWLARSYTQHIELVNRRVTSLAEENSILRIKLAAELNAIDMQRANAERAQEALERQIRSMSMWLNVYTREISRKLDRIQPSANNRFISRILQRQHLLQKTDYCE